MQNNKKKRDIQEIKIPPTTIHSLIWSTWREFLISNITIFIPVTWNKIHKTTKNTKIYVKPRFTIPLTSPCNCPSFLLISVRVRGSWGLFWRNMWDQDRARAKCEREIPWLFSCCRIIVLRYCLMKLALVSEDYRLGYIFGVIIIVMVRENMWERGTERQVGKVEWLFWFAVRLFNIW